MVITMYFVSNPFDKKVTQLEGDYFTVIREKDGKLYLSNGAIIKQTNEGKYFDISTSEKYGAVYEADNINEINSIVGYAPVEGSTGPDYLGF